MQSNPSRTSKPRADVLVSGGGSLYVFCALTDAAKEWIESNVSQEGFQPQFPEVLYVEHRYRYDLTAGMRTAGLAVYDRDREKLTEFILSILPEPPAKSKSNHHGG